ncbi:hypothetical protein ACLB2K_042469 [Fragaria x ananassa]
MEVTEPSFKSCNSSSPIATYSSGSDYITLERPGRYYFLCGAPRHCEAGQKVEVVISLPTTDDHVSSPSLGPSGLSTPSTPSPAPSSTPRPQERLPHSAATTTINAPKLAFGDYHGSYRRLKPAKYMALTDTQAVCGGTNNSETNYSWSRSFVMELQPDCTKHRKLPAYTAHVMRSATFFLPWSCKMIGDGYNEFL